MYGLFCPDILSDQIIEKTHYDIECEPLNRSYICSLLIIGISSFRVSLAESKRKLIYSVITRLFVCSFFFFF